MLLTAYHITTLESLSFRLSALFQDTLAGREVMSLLRNFNAFYNYDIKRH